ncbi:MAG: copper-binding protein [Cyanobium sp.]
MANPFSVRWLTGWTFQTVLMEGEVQVEAHGFGICLRTPVLPGESPVTAADRLVLAEDRRRRALHSAWLRGQRLITPVAPPALSGAVADPELRVVDPSDLQPLIRLAA